MNLDLSKVYQRFGGIIGPLFSAVALLAAVRLTGIMYVPWVIVFAPLWVFMVAMVLIITVVVIIIGALTR